MHKTLMAVAALAVLICLIAIRSAPSAEAEQVAWFGNRSEDGASLIYGTPDSDHAKIAFNCQAGQDDLVFVYEHKPIEAKDGVKVDVILAADGIEVTIPTTGLQLELDDAFLLEGQVKLDGRLRKLLMSQGTLIVTVEDGADEFPLDGIATAAKHVIETCSPNG